MPCLVRCSHCNTQYQVRDDLAGRKAKCEKCGEVLVIPSPQPAAAAPKSTPAPAQAAPKPQPVAAAPKPAPAQAAPKSQPAAAAPALAPAGPAVEKKRRCPHCGSIEDASESFCSMCGLNMKMKVRKRPKDLSSREWLFALLGIVVALALAPLFFLAIAVAAGGEIALLASAIEILLIAAIGSFSLACRIFGQDAPEPSDIFRIIFMSTFPASIVVPMLHLPRLPAEVLSTVVAMILASLICMFQLGMPVWHSIAICIAYNVFSTIIKVVGILVLVILFAGWLVTTTPSPFGPGGGTPSLDSPFPGVAPPGGPFEDSDDDASTAQPLPGLVLATVPYADAVGWHGHLARA